MTNNRHFINVLQQKYKEISHKRALTGSQSLHIFEVKVL